MTSTAKLVAAALMALAPSVALAGPGADLATAHIEAVASGPVADITAHYADQSVFEWVGGPLDGTYVGRDAITGVWTRFRGAQGTLTAEITNLQESANPAGATVTADVRFVGQNTIPVRYVLTYRGETLVSETWQIDPHLGSN